MAKPYDFDRFGFGRAGEYFANFSKENVWRKGGKAKTPWAFSFQAKRMTRDRKAKGQRSGASIPNHGISSSNAWAYCISNPNAWARGISSQNAQGQRGEALGIFY